MRTETRLMFGPVAAVIFFAGVAGLALLVPGYSHLQQSISAIGKLGSPTRIPFALVFVCYACSLLVFASGLFRAAAKRGAPKLSAYLLCWYALTQLGIAVFATPHPLHNIFGLLSFLGLLAPLALAFIWRRAALKGDWPTSLVVVSFVLGALVLGSLVLNLSELFPQSALWQLLSPYPGLGQRLLVAVWLAWLVTAGLLMRRQGKSTLTPVFELGKVSPEFSLTESAGICPFAHVHAWGFHNQQPGADAG
ncbi:MAG TPA: DUF998 domain-containing protein [Rhizomicrobium sp.]|nr:DUF998 domain-containing protein [Rhizomicrobium sp.]